MTKRRRRKKKSRHWSLALAALAGCKHGIISRYVTVGGRWTSFRLDAATWAALADVAKAEGLSVNELCWKIERAKPEALSTTVAIRAWLLGYFYRNSGRARGAR
jgi:predicted DNA-binding ribbon-helix-helix protein